MSSKPFVLVDGSSYLFRAFHALPPLTTSDGQPTNAIRGVVSMLKKLVAEYDPTHMAVVFDAKGKTFRDDLYAEYKANRPPMPDELRVQIEPLHQLVEALGFPMLVIPGVEADDVIGTLSTQAAKAGMDVLISTGDKDMAQLVEPHVTLINTMTDTLMDREGVVGKFGVPPEQIVDWLALVGDSVDNIPGVPKCGPKTATKWLNLYGSFDAVIAAAPEMKGKIGEHLRGALEQLPLSHELATIKRDVELDYAPAELSLREPDLDNLKDMYRQLEFKSWLYELSDTNEPGVAAAESAKRKREYDLVVDEASLDDWIARLENADLFAFDTETDSLDYMRAQIVGVSFAVERGEAAYVPCGHDYPGAPDQISRERLLEKLKPLLESDERKKVGQHLKYDAHVLLNHGVTLRGIGHDTMLQSYVLNSTGSRHDMDTLADRYLGIKTIKFEEVAGKGAKQIGFNQVSLDIAGDYAAEDADITLQLHETLWPKLQAVPALAKLYHEVELPLAGILTTIEHGGVLIDRGVLQGQSQELAEQMIELEKQAHELAGQPFNLGSPKQLQEILFEKMELPVIRKTPKGQPSTAEDVLTELAKDYPLPKVITEYRAAGKLKSTYTDKLPQVVNADTGRVHTSYNQAVAATGRLSSVDPNLQNIPIRRPEGRRIRQAFVAPDGFVMLAADYSQIELRIMAHLSEDPGLMKAFASDQDIHKFTASEVFDVALEDVDGDQRRAAKAVNFGLIYGMSAFGLAKNLGIERSMAQDYIDRYFGRYPGVKYYMDRTREQAHETGYVETLFGRRLYLPDINAKNPQLRQYAERTAINAPMQGTAADIIKMAMINVDAWQREDAPDVRMIMQVHDELVFEIPEAELEGVSKVIVSKMETAAELKVPLRVDIGTGNNWDEAH